MYNDQTDNTVILAPDFSEFHDPWDNYIDPINTCEENYNDPINTCKENSDEINTHTKDIPICLLPEMNHVQSIEQDHQLIDNKHQDIECSEFLHDNFELDNKIQIIEQQTDKERLNDSLFNELTLKSYEIKTIDYVNLQDSIQQLKITELMNHQIDFPSSPLTDKNNEFALLQDILIDLNNYDYQINKIKYNDSDTKNIKSQSQPCTESENNSSESDTHVSSELEHNNVSIVIMQMSSRLLTCQHSNLNINKLHIYFIFFFVKSIEILYYNIIRFLNKCSLNL